MRVLPVSPQRIEVVIPDTSYTFDGADFPLSAEQQLQPGVQTVEVSTTPPGVPNVVARSNQAIMMLTPHIQAINPTAPDTLVINGTRLFSGDMQCETLVGPLLFPSESYTAASPTSITITLPDMAEIGDPGVYPVRVRVNGAESIGGVNGVELPL
ncbi:MAG: hypothetical protein IAE80_00365 [Anaerolinea sp.]|nr:hypothetical protein [Anaerolinea sp.]